MAINIWEQDGKPISYNPLPPASVSMAALPHGEYELTFSAKSVSGARIRITDNGNLSYSHDLYLTPEMKNYKYSLFQKPMTNRFYIFNMENATDIIIENIKLVERGAGRATINGIDGFLSGKWTVHANAKIIDDETLELNATTGTQATYIELTNIEVGETYTAYLNDVSSGYIYYEQRNANNALLQTSYGTNKSKTLTILPDTKKIMIGLYNAGAAGTFIFKKPMIIKGTSTVPYEKKRGERMVIPQAAGKNLVLNQDFINSFAYAQALIQITKNEDGGYRFNNTRVGTAEYLKQDFVSRGMPYTYTVWAKKGTSDQLDIRFYNQTLANYKATATFTLTDEYKPYSITLPVTDSIEGHIFRLYMWLKSSSDIHVLNMQLEEGLLSTSFEPVRIGVLRKAEKLPAKNLVRQSEVTITAPTTTSVIHDELVPTEIGKIYTISAIIPTGATVQPRIGSSSIVYGANNLVGDGTRKSMSIVATDTFITLRKYNSGVAGTFTIKEIQVEENEFITSFEPYRLRPSRRAIKVPKKNMFNGYYEEGYLTSTVFNEKPNTATQGQRTTGWMYCKPNTKYVISGGDRSSWHFKNTAGVIDAGSALEAITTPSNAAFMRVYYSSNGTHENIQIEEGTAPTPIEPFKLSSAILTNKGLEFNGKTEWITVNHTNMTTVDVTVRFKVGDTKPGTYKMIWGAVSTPHYIGVRPNTMDVFCSLNLGGVQVTYLPPLTAKQKLTTDKVHEIRLVYNGSYVRIYLDGALVYEVVESRQLTAYSSSYIGRYTGTPFFHDNAILSAKSTGLFDFDFTNYRNNLGTKFKDKNGVEGIFSGSPIQLNQQSKR